MGMVTGLRYESLEVIMRMRCVPPRDRAAIFDQVRIMEPEALKCIRKQ